MDKNKVNSLSLHKYSLLYGSPEKQVKKAFQVHFSSFSYCNTTFGHKRLKYNTNPCSK